jgi:hypothetical protein
VAKKVLMGPICPKCGKPPYDLVRIEPQAKGPPLKRTIWFCPDSNCNPWGEIMNDDAVWPK